MQQALEILKYFSEDLIRLLLTKASLFRDFTLKVADSFSNTLKNLRATWFPQYNFAQLSGMGLNAIYILTVLPTLYQLSEKIGTTLAIRSIVKKSKQLALKVAEFSDLDESMLTPEQKLLREAAEAARVQAEHAQEEWKAMHGNLSYERYLFYKVLELLAYTAYIPVAAGEIAAIAAGASMVGALPFTLSLGYGLFMAHDVICFFELRDQWKHESDPQEKKALQNAMITKAFSVLCLGLGLTFGLIGLGVFSVSSAGLVAGSPILLAASGIAFGLKMLNEVVSKDIFRKTLFKVKQFLIEGFGSSADIRHDASGLGSEQKQAYDYKAIMEEQARRVRLVSGANVEEETLSSRDEDLLSLPSEEERGAGLMFFDDALNVRKDREQEEQISNTQDSLYNWMPEQQL